MYFMFSFLGFSRGGLAYGSSTALKPCSKTLSFSVLGHEHTLPCLKMWAIVGESADDKAGHKAQWQHVLKVYKERGLGYSEDELERRASEVKEREDSKK